ncbi:MAG: hypothetical protein JWM68_519 [Verrucomicrobiales bacterium]|nr:hypothetical protein [Verrucomicrobiales bacterium]
MIRLVNIALVVCFSITLLGCRRSPVVRDSEADARGFVGKTVAEFLAAQHVTLADCKFIDEPPMVLRELAFPTAGHRSLVLALKREPSLFSERRQWSPDAVRKAEIVGFRYADR